MLPDDAPRSGKKHFTVRMSSATSQLSSVLMHDDLYATSPSASKVRSKKSRVRA